MDVVDWFLAELINLIVLIFSLIGAALKGKPQPKQDKEAKWTSEK